MRPVCTIATGARPARKDFLTRTHSMANVAHVLSTHAALLAWFWVAWRTVPLAAYLPLSVIACLIHQRAMSEWLHEGAHRNFVINGWWNDRLTDALVGIVMVVSTVTYRRTHYLHHDMPEFFVSPDPDTNFLTVDSKRAFWGAILRDVTGVTVLQRQLQFWNTAGGAMGSPRFMAAAVVVHSIGFAVVCMLGRFDAYLLYYASLATGYPLLNRIRTIGQHATIAPDGRAALRGSRASRTVDAGLLDRIFVTSPRLMYHYDHHRYPHLPYRALRHMCTPRDDINEYATSRWAVLRAAYASLL